MTKKPRSKNGAKKIPLQRGIPSRWLVLVDEKPIRDAALAEYHGVETQLNKAREQLEAFELGDRPAYQRWEAKALGPLMTELRGTIQALDEKRRIFEAIEEEMFWAGCTELMAYRRVMKLMNEPEDEPEDDSSSHRSEEKGDRDPHFSGNRLFGDSDLPPGVDAAAFNRMSRHEREAFREFYEMIAAMYEAATGRRPPTLEEALAQDHANRHGGGPKGAGPETPRGGPNPGKAGERDPRSGRFPRFGPAAAPENPTARHEAELLKDLYRKLVRQLHPDRNRDQTPREKELWHQVQEAYRARDLGKLEAVAGRLEVSLPGAAAKLPVQLLLRMARELRDALRGLRQQLNEARSHPAWRFRSQTETLAKFETKRRRQLETDRITAQARLERLTARLDELAAQAARKTRKRKPRKTVAEEQEFFPF